MMNNRITMNKTTIKTLKTPQYKTKQMVTKLTSKLLKTILKKKQTKRVISMIFQQMKIKMKMITINQINKIKIQIR